MRFSDPQAVAWMTPHWKGERLDDGRPRVPGGILTRMEKVTTEEAWSVLWQHGYRHQFQGDWKTVHPEPVLVGRALTATFAPQRPDLHDHLLTYGQEEEGHQGFFNAWVIDSLQQDDVMVVDMYDKIREGTFVGGNLSTAVAVRTGRGQVIWGGIRDLQQIAGIENLYTFYRGEDPTPIRETTLIGLNTPCRIGGAICMPGDVVLGSRSGVIFIPPQLAEEVVVASEKTRLRDMFGLQRIREGVYTSAEIDTAWTEAIEADFHCWRRESAPDELAHLDWETDEDDG